jgi:galactokinase
MTLTRIERNQLFEAIAASGLDPAECSLIEIGSKVLISHSRSSSTLEFSDAGKYSTPRYEVEYYVDDGHQSHYEPRGLKYVLPILTKWGNEVKETTDAPDLWGELRRTREFVLNMQRTESGNTPFTQDEQRQIAAQLQETKEQINEQFELTDEQIEQIDARLDEAEEASKRIGRKDWLLLFGGTILNLIVTDTLTPGVAGHILTTVVQGIAHLFGGGPPQILA